MSKSMTPFRFKLCLPSYRVLILLTLALSGFYASASESTLKIKESETAAVTAINKPYFDAFKGQPEDNWVYQLANQNKLQAACYLAQDHPVTLGESTAFDGIPMTCIQIGMSTRVFWPTRWVDYCNGLGEPYSECMMNDIQE